MFNKETEYALRSLVYIQYQNYQGLRPGIGEIAKEIEAPQAFTAKILQRMVRLGFVVSLKGKGGGFYFDENRPELTLKELILSTEGGKLFEGCGFGMKKCDNNNPCPLHDQYGPIRESINKLVSEQTIQGLAKKTNESFIHHLLQSKL
jgi:Rrf2 family protein